METKPIDVLLIEDDPADAELIQNVLSHAKGLSIRLQWSDRISTGLKRFHEGRFDVILLDLSLPDSHGFDSFDRVRIETSGTPIVILSGLNDEEGAARAIREGAQDYLLKETVTAELLAHSLSHAIERKIADEALKANHQLLRSVIEGITDSVYVKDLQGRYVMINSAGARIFGRPPEEIVGKNDLELFPHVTAKQITEDDRRIMRSGEMQTLEELATINDISRTYLSSKGPWRNHQGEVIGLIGISWDITDRKQAEEALHSYARQQAVLAELGRHALGGLDLGNLLEKTALLVAQALAVESCKILELLPGGKNLLFRIGIGWDEGLTRTGPVEDSEWRGSGALLENAAVRVEEPTATTSSNTPALAGEQGAVKEIRVVIPGSRRPFGVLSIHSKAPRRFTQEEIGFLQVVANMLATAIERSRAEEIIQHQAYYDALTGLPNRSLMESHLSLALARADRHNDMVALMFLDLDRFKRINDTLGHLVGDQLLRAVSERLSTCVRDGDTFARMGGDEFTILLPEIDSVERVTRLAERILEAFTPSFRLAGHELNISASIGIALSPDSGSDPETLLKNADAALYRAKERGRNTFCFFSPVMSEKTVGQLSIESALRQGLARNEFLLHFQPQVDLKTGEIVGFESLLRWHRPETGFVSPAEFIPVAEETGLILSIGEWMPHAACAQNKAWQEAGFPFLRIAVNLSARQLHRDNLVEKVTRILQKTGLEPNALELELTESALMGKERETLQMLQELAAMGIALSIDDFGTGYSSLSHLKRFPIGKLKVDPLFVRDIATDPNDAVIAQTVIAMAHSLHLKAIAEGVETEAQLAFLRSIGCDEMQGYLFSRPLPAEEATALLSQRKRLSL